jgi:hypothetical protein
MCTINDVLYTSFPKPSLLNRLPQSISPRSNFRLYQDLELSGFLRECDPDTLLLLLFVVDFSPPCHVLFLRSYSPSSSYAPYTASGLNKNHASLTVLTGLRCVPLTESLYRAHIWISGGFGLSWRGALNERSRYRSSL